MAKTVYLDGEHLRAFLAAHEAFLKSPDVPRPREKRRVEEYKVWLETDREFYRVYMRREGAPVDEPPLWFQLRRRDFRVVSQGVVTY